LDQPASCRQAGIRIVKPEIIVRDANCSIRNDCALTLLRQRRRPRPSPKLSVVSLGWRGPGR
jgi:hypothetical protein